MIRTQAALHGTSLAGLPVYQFGPLAEWPVHHAIFTRHGGVSTGPFDSLNLSRVVGDYEHAVAENVRRVYAAMDTAQSEAVRVSMVHGSRVIAADHSHAGTRVPTTDGLVTATPGLSLVMTFGDCQPILLYDPVHHVLALGHAGWRGTLTGIVASLVQAMRIAFDSAPGDLLAMLGPAIGSCCYEVRRDVIEAAQSWPEGEQWLRSRRRDRAFFDLTAANRAHLHRAGVYQVAVAGICTACRTDEFFSYRAEKPATGRFGVMAMLL